MESTKTSTSQFHVDLGDIQLSPEAAQRIEAKIQEAVLSELAAYKPNPDDDYKPRPWWPKGGPIVVIPPRDWWGFIIRIPRDVLNDQTILKEAIQKANQPF